MSARLSTAGVIATRNQREFVVEAILGLAHQVDELIVVDDASSDGTAEQIERLGAPRVRLIRHLERRGVSASFNRAALEASADLLIIQGGDDRSLPGRVEAQSRAFANDDVVLVASAPRVINESGLALPDWTAPEFFQEIPPGRALEYLFYGTNFVCAPSVALRRSDYIDTGMFRRGLDQLQDYFMWLKLAERGQFVALNEPVVEYRKHSANLSRANVGIDSVPIRRQRAEYDFVLHRFLQEASVETLVRLSARLDLDGVEFAFLSPEAMVALIQLGHPDPIVVRRGLTFVFDCLSGPEGDAILSSMGLNEEDISMLSVKADHDNLSAVNKALSTRLRLGEPSGQLAMKGKR